MHRLLAARRLGPAPLAPRRPALATPRAVSHAAGLAERGGRGRSTAGGGAPQVEEPPAWVTELLASREVHEASAARRRQPLEPPAARGSQEDELQRQVALLTAQCAELTKQVQDMASSVQGLSAHRNLVLRAGRPATRDALLEFRPTLPMVEYQPTHVSQLQNEDLAILGQLGNHAAHKERLLREIMQVDGVSWEKAHEKLAEMDEYNEMPYWLQTTPYRLGISGAVAGAVASCALVFYAPAADWYGRNIAGEDLPDGCESVADLTVHQVGTWSWQWMEPAMGTLSFVLLCAQFTRSCMWKLNMRPYTELMQRHRADRLSQKYPMYDKGIVRAWAKHLPLVNATFFPQYRRNLGFRAVT